VAVLRDGQPPGVEVAGSPNAASRLPLADAAYEQLRRAILDGRLGEDHRLAEFELAAMLGVSRTPVRQALQRLELEGYLQRDEGGRLRVHRPTLQEVIEVFFVRELLEGYAARLAAQRVSDEELNRLDELVAADVAESHKGRIEELGALNEQIHDVLLVASRNRVLVDLIRGLRERIPSLKAFAVGTRSDRLRFAQEHAEISRLLRAGAERGIESLVRRHLQSARDLLIADLEPPT